MLFGTRSLSSYTGLAAINSSESVLIAAEDFNRLGITLQNASTGVVAVKLGSSDAGSTSYNFILGADTTLRSGNGGSVTLDIWKGSLYAISLTTGSHYLSVTEEVENT